MASIERLERAASRIIPARKAGHKVVVVVSAMGGETDRLLAMAESTGAPQSAARRRELDVLLSTGEQVTISLLSMILNREGMRARSYTGSQVPILTSDVHTRARIQSVNPERIQADLADGRIVIVAGFQGTSKSGDITTFGRGGSDLTAVALAGVLNASECQIFTDVDGIFTADPRIVEGARCLSSITYEEMLELASLGWKVMQTRAVEFAHKYGVPVRVLSSFHEVPGTLITRESSDMEEPLISGIATTRDEAKLTVRCVRDVPGVATQLLRPVSAANIEVDMIVQNASADGSTDFTFTVRRSDYEQTLALVRQVAEELEASEVTGDDKIAKVSLVGVGMRSHAGVASLMFETLAAENINIQMISTSEIKISVVIAERYLELAARALHSAFELSAGGSGQENNQELDIFDEP